MPKKRGGSRHLASANIRMNRPRIGSGVMRIENSHTGGINYTKSVGGLSFANSGGYHSTKGPGINLNNTNFGLNLTTDHQM